METKITVAGPDDLPFLLETENQCFPDYQKSSPRSIKTSLGSSNQTVLIIHIKQNKQWIRAGALILHHFYKTLRIFSVAVLRQYRNMQLGKTLVDHAIKIAIKNQNEKVSLEAEADNYQLITWYEDFGFKPEKQLADYYKKGKNAVRMVLQIRKNTMATSKENLIVIDKPGSFNPPIGNITIVSARNYISGIKYQKLKNARVFNLCSSYRYQSLGYYVSLLASARDHRAVPSATTMGDYKNIQFIKSMSEEIDELIQKSLNSLNKNRLELNIYFGQTCNENYRNLANKLYSVFETPLLKVIFLKEDKWYILKVSPIHLNKIEEGDMETVYDKMKVFFAKKRFNIPRLRNYKYDLAIFVNPDEKNPPSNAKALKEFEKAADKLDFYAEFITREESHRITEFDALLIRETTSVSNHTYKLSRLAYAEGLVVIDDPWSILRCSNKIFLYERMILNRISIPYTKVLSKKEFRESLITDLQYPLVLKQPDGSFSLGVSKVENKKELTDTLNNLFKTSELVIAQSYMPSEFDWRIGILDHQPLFACKYFMAKDHWQIYNWKAGSHQQEGAFQTIKLENVPEKILKTAVKAANLIGDGLYGVDLKEINGNIYVIEVNDNPNIDYGIEDKDLKQKLYEQVIKSFLNRIEMSRNVSKYISADPD